ncbi:alpha-acetolactate decarboxylase [Pyrenochaeta sp. MPI-SDFR-AT-0127]|nr:alpha-acetolactate decarboxylase [Pyrenochaeta sp. MPI-SDFR-AT-0127]
MVDSVPNDIFQFSTYAALKAGFNQGQPRTADLSSHGTDGIGNYENDSLMIFKDGKAHILAQNGTASPAPLESRLLFAMVTTYQPTFRAKVPFVTLEDLDELISSSEFGPAKGVNTLMPFRITGVFESVDLDQCTKQNIAGSLFGFVIPAWMKQISGPRIQAHFIDANEEIGGRVADFIMADEATLSFAKCARFHLGFPQGEVWEAMKL